MDPYEERFQAFDHHAAHLLGAIRLCLKHGYMVPAMMLTFAAIDGMAWVYSEREGSSNATVFKAWTNKFMIGHLKEGIVDSADFWAARNGLLHVQSIYSRATDRGEAKAFAYIDLDSVDEFPATIDPSRGPIPVLLSARAIVDRLEIAIQEFRSFIYTSDRTDELLDRCGVWFDYGPPRSSS